MVDNRYATALVIACVLSILATVYLSVAIGTQHWYQYSSPTVRGEANVSELRSLYDEFMTGEYDEKTYGDTLFRLNGTVGLWWRCVFVPPSAHWDKEPDAKMTLECRNFTLSEQFTPKYKEPGNHNSGEDMLRTCRFCRNRHHNQPLFYKYNLHNIELLVPSHRVVQYKEMFSCVFYKKICGGANFCCHWHPSLWLCWRA
ncbi:hypothetical protein XENOCAPTIV_005586 [Xenoophorus captivus]|uniref:Claudin domain containing 1a n=1 Tax=Xenoophorus captivus TaxID=1517983 RepID=A0ABV0RXD0_9TELE